jgi:hypothetical protein
MARIATIRICINAYIRVPLGLKTNFILMKMAATAIIFNRIAKMIHIVFWIGERLLSFKIKIIPKINITLRKSLLSLNTLYYNSLLFKSKGVSL